MSLLSKAAEMRETNFAGPTNEAMLEMLEYFKCLEKNNLLK